MMVMEGGGGNTDNRKKYVQLHVKIGFLCKWKYTEFFFMLHIEQMSEWNRRSSCITKVYLHEVMIERRQHLKEPELDRKNN